MKDYAGKIRQKFIKKATAIADEQFRMERRNFWRSVFWQGENGDGSSHPLDDAHLEQFIGRVPSDRPFFAA